MATIYYRGMKVPYSEAAISGPDLPKVTSPEILQRATVMVVVPILIMVTAVPAAAAVLSQSLRANTRNPSAYLGRNRVRRDGVETRGLILNIG